LREMKWLVRTEWRRRVAGQGATWCGVMCLKIVLHLLKELRVS